MAGVSINTGSADYRDELSKVSEDQWNAIFSQRRLYIHTEFEHGCECACSFVADPVACSQQHVRTEAQERRNQLERTKEVNSNQCHRLRRERCLDQRRLLRRTTRHL